MTIRGRGKGPICTIYCDLAVTTTKLTLLFGSSFPSFTHVYSFGSTCSPTSILQPSIYFGKREEKIMKIKGMRLRYLRITLVPSFFVLHSILLLLYRCIVFIHAYTFTWTWACFVYLLPMIFFLQITHWYQWHTKLFFFFTIYLYSFYQ